MTFSQSKLETIYKWVTTGRDLYAYTKANQYFYAITDNQFFDQHDHIRIDGSYRWRVTAKNYINLNEPDSNKVQNINEMNLFRMSKTDDSKLFVFPNENDSPLPFNRHNDHDTHDFFEFKNGGINKFQQLDINESSWFKEIINDSVCLTLVLFDFRNNSKYSKHPTEIDKKPIGTYWNEERKTIDVAFAREGDSCDIMSIHYPSKNVVKRERVVAPYLGRFVMNTGDGYTLSIGKDGLLYKHDLNIFASDSIYANFSFKNSADYELQFSDNSFGAITDWLWDFGDGNTSSERHPIHNFTSAGTKDVQLIVTDEYGNSDTISKQIEVTQKLKAEFDFGVFSGQAPFTVEFKNYSSDNAVRYIWNFGDGTYSYEMEPAHTYTIPGEYSISLTVFDENEKYSLYVQPKKVMVTE
jgi:PKD repeat protein